MEIKKFYKQTKQLIKNQNFQHFESYTDYQTKTYYLSIHNTSYTSTFLFKTKNKKLFNKYYKYLNKHFKNNDLFGSFI